MDGTREGFPRQIADRYEIERELGRGGMATVYLARDLKHGRQVAMKVLHADLASALGAERFQREIRITARLDHPHIIPILDSGQHGSSLWYTMPYVRGESLRDRLRREVQLPVDVAVKIAQQAAQALECAHGLGVVHRDIKPENILLSDGLARVADFGIAQALEQLDATRLTGTGLVVGTPAYMSPEQASAGPVDARSDQYSLGCVLYEMLAGEPPYTGPSAQAITFKRLSDPLPSIRRLRESVSVGLEHALSRSLAKIPADRFATINDFGAALVAGATFESSLQGSQSAPREGPPLAKAQWPGASMIRSPARIGLLVVAALVLAAAMARLLLGGRDTGRLDSTLVAIAPFDVLEPSLALWHEGLVDVLSRNLDGAGTLRTVPPTVVIRRWSGRADAESATRLARRAGAGLAVFGTLEPAGPDSVRLSATLFDVSRGHAVGEVQLSDGTARMTRLADSATVALLRRMDRTDGTSSFGLRGSLGTRSLPALKQFLQAEQYYRRGQWDSALVASEAAVGLDSSFALAWRRAGWVIGWRDWDIPRMSTYTGRAATLNRGLGPRDSLLLVVDSLFASPTPSWSWARRLMSTAQDGVLRYPDDPEFWQSLGEARAHLGGGPWYRSSPEGTMAAFQRVLVLDSAFVPAYPHLIALTAAIGDTTGARALTKQALALSPTTPLLRLLDRAVNPSQGERLAGLLDSVPLGTLVGGGSLLVAVPDPTQTAVQVYQALVRRVAARLGTVSEEEARSLLAGALAARGRLNEAYREGPDPWLLGQLAPVVGVKDTTAVLQLRYLPGRSGPGVFLRWSEIGDTLALLRTLHTPVPSTSSGYDGQYLARAAAAYLALARRDTANAVAAFTAVPDSLCWGEGCAWVYLTRAQLLAATGRQADADARLSDVDIYADLWAPADLLLLLERARLAEQAGRREQALRWYRYVASAWAPADVDLHRFVEEAREGARRLGARTPPLAGQGPPSPERLAADGH